MLIGVIMRNNRVSKNNATNTDRLVLLGCCRTNNNKATANVNNSALFLRHEYECRTL